MYGLWCMPADIHEPILLILNDNIPQRRGLAASPGAQYVPFFQDFPRRTAYPEPYGNNQKAATPAEAKTLVSLPNVGKKTAADLSLLGFDTPSKLKGQDPYRMYVRLCEVTKTYHDPCMLDVFIAITDFMGGGTRKDWWHFTAERQANFHLVESKVKRFKKT